MRPLRLSLGLLVVGLALAALPPVHQGIAMAFRSMYGRGALDQSEPVLRRAINAHPNDAEVWLGVAEARASRPRLGRTVGPSSSPADPESVVQAYEKSIELQPGAPAARLRLAMFHLEEAGQLGQVSAGVSLTPPPARSADQQRNLDSALPLLEQARAAEPDNAACDYWLAWCLFAARRDKEAHGALRSALGKDQWDLHDHEAAVAVSRVAELAGVPAGSRGIWADAARDRFPCWAALRQVARRLAAEGDDFRARGQDEQAIASYLAIARMGYVVRRNAFSLIEGLVGLSVSALASASFADRHEVEDAERARQARAAAFAAYLRAHAHAADADWYVADMKAAATWLGESRQVTDALMPRVTRNLAWAGALNAAALVTAFASILGLALLVLVISLGLRWWGEPRADPAFGYGGWVLLLLLAVVPGQVAALIALRMMGRDAMSALVWTLGPLTSLAGAVAWVVAAGTVAARRRRAPARAFRAALAGLRQLALPTLIALLVLGLLLAPIVHHGLVQMDRDEMRMLEQGEVQYWGIGTGHVAPGAATTPADR